MPTDPRLTEAEFEQLDTDEREPRRLIVLALLAGFVIAGAVGIWFAIH